MAAIRKRAVMCTWDSGWSGVMNEGLESKVYLVIDPITKRVRVMRHVFFDEAVGAPKIGKV
ncbi:hypothetical protein E2562_039031 [Oryza meyeriana var. granulata]|uniref:Uncharacterized protein n=1 Tax=Oryza meyeriana var. granulata TaxID=110450 RepID=A0A6G1CWT7_9ORYZ|nr:hypothetical protein E2562_039031 [Oryza meyeriana var. granulata]